MDIGIGLFILLAVAGYLFLSRRELYTRDRTMRQTGYHLFFNSVIAGIFLMVLAMVPASFVLYYFHGRFLPSTNKEILAVWLASFLLGWLATELMRLSQPRPKIMSDVLQAARDRGDHLAALLEIARIQFRLVELSLENDKAYIGLVGESGIVSEGEDIYIAVAPVLSGYREKNTRQLFITRDYSRVLLSMRDEQKKSGKKAGKKGIPDFWGKGVWIVIPMKDVKIARMVDRDQLEYPYDDDLQVIGAGGEVRAEAA